DFTPGWEDVVDGRVRLSGDYGLGVVKSSDAKVLRELHFIPTQCLHHHEPQSRQGDHHDEQYGERRDHGRGSAQFVPGNPGERFAVPPDARGEDEHVLHGPGEADADDEPDEAGHVTVLDGQHRPDEWTCTADGREVMAEEDPLTGGVIVL